MAGLLGIDTSTSMGTVAIGDGARVLAELMFGVGPRHSAALLPAVRFALEHAGLEPRRLDGVVVGAGPGSFTGVRIAAATAKGLVHAAKLPLYAYSTLLGLAASVAVPATAARTDPAAPAATATAASKAGSRPICAVLDARRGEVYAACYRFAAGGRAETLMPPAALPIHDLVQQMAALQPIFVGDGAVRHGDALAGADVAPPHLGMPRASALLWLAAVQPDEGRVAEPARWEPEYVRASGAERRVRG